MGLVPDDRPLSDGQIRECWARALGWGRRGPLSRRLAGATADALEAAGVTEKDLDRAIATKEEESMRRRETTSLRASLARAGVAEYRRREPESGTAEHIVQLLADLRIMCDKEGLDAELLFELSEARAGSYPGP